MTKTNNTNKNANTNTTIATPVKANPVQASYNLAKIDPKINLSLDHVDLVESQTGRTIPAGFVCNGEDDRQAAINLARYCMSNAETPEEGQALIYKTQMLLINNITPDEVIDDDYDELYMDYKRGIIVRILPISLDQYLRWEKDPSKGMLGVKVIVSLSEEERKLFKSKAQIKHLLLEKLDRYYENGNE